MLKIVTKVSLLVFILFLTGCSTTPKSDGDEVTTAVLEKVTEAVKNQALFQEIMLDDAVVKHSPGGSAQTPGDGKTNSAGNKVAADDSGKNGAVADKIILAYALHPKYFFWKAKNDPAMNPLLAKVDKFVDKLNVNLSDVKQIESDQDHNTGTCSANVSMGQDKMAIKYTVTYAENGKFDVKIDDSGEKKPSDPVSQPIRGSIFALCTTWETIKPATFPPANPQIIADGNDMHSNNTNKPDIKFGTIIPLDLVLDGNVSSKDLRSYKILQNRRGTNTAAK